MIGKTEIRYFFFFALLVVIVKFQLLFLNYLNFIYEKYKTFNVKVVNQYKKNGYYVLKLKKEGVVFYTKSKEDLKNLLNETLKITVITDKLGFIDYLKTFYLPSFNLRLMPLDRIESYITTQHKDEKSANLFNALFLGGAVDYKTKKELSMLGISHLFALSGLHLGIISFVLYWILYFPYKIFHRFFPYRNRYVDLAFIIFVFEFGYLYFTDFPPSLVRALVLETVIFLYAYYLKNPFSLKILASVVFLSLLFFTRAVFTLGFLLSMLGVFYIYLFFRYVKVNVFNTVILSFYMFLNMSVYSHVFFGNFNYYQLLSPLVNSVFVLFYISEIFLHLINCGGILDIVVEKYLTLGDKGGVVFIPYEFGVVFFGLSVGAFFSKRLFFALNLLSLGVIIYIVGVYSGCF